MTAEETKPSTSPPPKDSSTPPVEDNQEDKSPLKDNVEVVEIVEVQTFHKDVEEAAKEDQGGNVDVPEVGTEAGANNEAKVEDEAGVADRAEDPQPSERDAKVESGHQTETKAGAEIDSQADNDSEAQPAEPKSDADDGEAPPADEPKSDADNVEAPAEPESGADDGEAPAEPESGADDGGTAEADGGEEEEKPRKLTVDDIKTAPMDFRFPTTNQAKHCFTRYVEYHKCVQAKGDDNPDCDKYARYYRSLCPGEWVDKWNEERENGTFPGPL